MSKLRAATHWLGSNRSTVLAYAIVLGSFAASYVGVLAARPLFVPDSRYYLGMSYWFSGMDMAAAAELVNAAADASFPGGRLTAEHLFGSGVVQPRVIFPFLSMPFVWLFGTYGLAVTSALISVTLVVLLTWMLSRSYGLFPTVATMVLAMSSLFIVWYSAAMLTESLSALWAALMLLFAWRYQERPSRWLVILLILTTVLAGFTRQSTLIPAGAFAAAWAMSVVLRNRNHRWAVPALAVCATTVVVQLGQNLIFPAVSLNNSSMGYAAPTNPLETGAYIVKVAVSVLGLDFLSFANFDHALIVLIGLSLVSIVLFWRRSESHLLVGAILGLAIYNVGNGVPTSFRYAVPGLVFYLASVALLFSHVASTVGDRGNVAVSPPATNG